ncbi:hypothetical protein [Streptomyces sp. NPDC127084]|uniref:allene oxide cyclase barrel-like domain-containing protein n=1 Tax=Streptomyces sp. NPDC127084 TaxID=3347133 RepID=UPI00365C3A07
MRHFTGLGLSAATGLAAALCCASVASAAAPSPDTIHPWTPHGKSETFELALVTTASNFIDVDPTGSSQGDELVATGNVLQDDAAVGQFDQVCTVTRVEADQPAAFQCQVTFTLAEGQITIQGVFPLGAPASDITLAITGGTGSYLTARGYVQSISTSETESVVSVHLIR